MEDGESLAEQQQLHGAHHGEGEEGEEEGGIVEAAVGDGEIERGAEEDRHAGDGSEKQLQGEEGGGM